VNFYTDIDRMLSTRIWKKVKAPWLAKKAEDVYLCAEYVAP
jgi:hypothetical protein